MGVNWESVAVAWALSTITTFAVVGIACLVQHFRRSTNRSNNKFKRNDSLKSENSNYTRTSVASNETRKTTASTSNCAPYKRVPTREISLEPIQHNRRISDFVQKWCGEHELPEVIASCLRENGFISKHSVESLRAHDVATLGLPNRGLECHLRTVLEDLERSKTGSDNRPKFRKRSNSDDTSSTTGHGYHSTSVGDSATPNDRSLSYTHLALDEGDCPSISTLSSVKPRVVTSRPQKSKGKVDREFYGYLSDAGLYELAGMLGHEWQHLATVLSVPHPLLDHIKSNHPHDARQQISDMLRLWRDTAHGTKEQVKGALFVALQRVQRTDMAELLMKEQVDGSNEGTNARGGKLTSLI